MTTPLNIVLIGPPGAGKSTIAEALIRDRQMEMISTGQQLRIEVKKRTPLGRIATGYLEHGDLLPDSVMDRMLRSYLETVDPEVGILLDGYPRTVHQAFGLSAMLADYDRELHAVVALDVANEEIIRRLSGRRICEGPGLEPFPIHIDDLASMLRCRERGGHAVQRDDDRPEVVQQRLTVYHAQTEPVLAFYSDLEMLVRVDASFTPAEVARRVEALLDNLAA